MLLHDSSIEDDLQTTTPVTPSADRETTHVPDTSEEASSAGSTPVGVGRGALEVGVMGQSGSGASVEEDRRRARPAWEACDQGGAAVSGEVTASGAGERVEEECGRERLNRHRVAMVGRVWIPDTWGQEGLLKDYVDCAAIDRALMPSELVSAREALVEECRRAEPGRRFRIESSCLST